MNPSGAHPAVKAATAAAISHRTTAEHDRPAVLRQSRLPMARGMETGRQKAGSYVFFFFTIIPAMIVSGFMPDWNVLPFELWLSLAAVGGAVGGFVWAEGQRWPVGILSGGIGGAGVVGATFAYVSWRVAFSETFWSIELVLPALVGLLPAWGLYRALGARSA